MEEIHEAMGALYPLPDLLSLQFIVQVIADEDDVVVMAIGCKRTTEAFLLMDQSWKTPKWRFQWFAFLHLKVVEMLRSLGYTDVNCWVPPTLAASFGKRLVRDFGWVKGKWQNFCLEL